MPKNTSSRIGVLISTVFLTCLINLARNVEYVIWKIFYEIAKPVPSKAKESSVLAMTFCMRLPRFARNGGLLSSYSGS
jgi:hypothetical protein